MQKEADDALVFAEKEDLLTETSTAELSEHGQRFLSVYDGHFRFI